MRGVRAACVAAVVAGAVVLAGCEAGPPSGEVSGTVSFDGAPVEKGSITFTPADGKGPTAGGTIQGGRYSVAKVPVGASKVSITGDKETGKKKLYDTPDSPVGVMTSNYLPEKFSGDDTELRFDVKPGTNEKNWALTK